MTLSYQEILSRDFESAVNHIIDDLDAVITSNDLEPRDLAAYVWKCTDVRQTAFNHQSLKANATTPQLDAFVIIV